MKDFVSSWNVSFNWEERLRDQEKYVLYVSDCFWVLDIDGYYEFYYNPRLFWGKIKTSQMPAVVIERMKECSAVFSNGQFGFVCIDSNIMRKSSIKFRKLEKEMRIGNWFHAQGQNYATWKGLFICDDMYVEGVERECFIKEINRGVTFDMMRMGCQTRTPHYIKNIFDLSIFQGVTVSCIRIYPFDDDDEWDARRWVRRFNAHSEYAQKYHSQFDMDNIRELRAEVFQHTVNVVRNGKYSIDGKTFVFSNDDVLKMMKDTVFYENKFDVTDIPTISEDTRIVVRDGDCLSVAREMQLNGYNVAVLNMASRRNPGGGVLGGAGAQEENLFRRTNLFQSMFRYAQYAEQYGLKKSDKQYPLDRNYGGVYTPDALVFRGEEKDGYPLLGDDAFRMSFIAVPGMNRPELNQDGMIVDSLVEPIKNKIRTILRIGLLHRHDALVLGALGCGAFCNPPKHIARLFHEVIDEQEFKNKYRLIAFAILDDHNAHRSHNPEGNYKPFAEEFAEILQ